MLLSLKDNAGLVKMYAFVDVRDYQKVVVSDASKGIEAAAQNYINGADVKNNDKIIEKDIIIRSITSSVIDGNTYYYMIDSDKNKYKVSIKVNADILPFLKNEDKVSIRYNINNINEIIEIKK